MEILNIACFKYNGHSLYMYYKKGIVDYSAGHDGSGVGIKYCVTIIKTEKKRWAGASANQVHAHLWEQSSISSFVQYCDYPIGKRELVASFSLVCGLCTVCLGLFALLLGESGRLCSVTLPGHRLYCFAKSLLFFQIILLLQKLSLNVFGKTSPGTFVFP